MTAFKFNPTFNENQHPSLDGQLLIFFSLKNPFLYTSHSEFYIFNAFIVTIRINRTMMQEKNN